MDDDLDDMDRDMLIAEVKKLRAGIRAHRLQPAEGRDQHEQR